MPKAELVPGSWEELLDLGRLSNTSPAFMEQLEILSGTNEQTVYREFLGNRPPHLPGVAQTPPYIRGVFEATGVDLEKLGKETLRQKVAMRLGVWSCFMDSGGNLDLIISPRALTWRPESVDDETMYKTLALTQEQAEHSQVNLRIMDSSFDEQERDGFGIIYMNGPAASHGVGDTAPAGSTSTVLLHGTSVTVLEGMWSEAEAAALNVDESRGLIRDALRDFRSGTA